MMESRPFKRLLSRPAPQGAGLGEPRIQFLPERRCHLRDFTGQATFLTRIGLRIADLNRVVVIRVDERVITNLDGGSGAVLPVKCPVRIVGKKSGSRDVLCIYSVDLTQEDLQPAVTKTLFHGWR